MLAQTADTIRNWIIGMFAGAIRHVVSPTDRIAAIQWLAHCRAVVARSTTPIEKLRELNALTDSRAVAQTITHSVTSGVKGYRNARLPLSVKIAIPATLAALPLIGAQGAGIAAFGTAIGLPVLLLIFIGVTGITAIIEAIVSDPAARPQIAAIIEIIIEDERLRRASAELKAAMRDRPADPLRAAMPEDPHGVADALGRMDPYAFERHVMSFFQAAGLVAWVTPPSNDFGIDGWALHDQGRILVQCKRNAPANRVGRPTVQQFKGVLEEQDAFRGYLVTTSSFTDEATESAAKNDKIRLIDIVELVGWHCTPPPLCD